MDRVAHGHPQAPSPRQGEPPARHKNYDRLCEGGTYLTPRYNRNMPSKYLALLLLRLPGVCRRWFYMIHAVVFRPWTPTPPPLPSPPLRSQETCVYRGGTQLEGACCLCRLCLYTPVGLLETQKGRGKSYLYLAVTMLPVSPSLSTSLV